MSVLVVGNKGQLGWTLERRARSAGLHVRGVDLPELDLTNRAAVHSVVAQGGYAAVINAAAYTAVDQAEGSADLAFAVNRDGVAHLADACEASGVPLIHVSTDYVFGGAGTRPYRPGDPIEPLGVYGQSKAAGEQQVRARVQRHLIIRTSWLYGAHGNNFVKTMIKLARERRELRVVNDQQGCPTYAADLADAIFGAIGLLVDGQAIAWGTHHVCNSGVTSWYHLADRAIRLAGDHEALAVERVVPIATADYPTPAARPAYSALDCGSFVTSFGLQMVPWERSLQAMINELYSSGPGPR